MKDLVILSAILACAAGAWAEQGDDWAEVMDDGDTFSMIVRRGPLVDEYVLRLDDFTWYASSEEHRFILDEPHVFEANDTPFAELTSLIVRLKVGSPHTIYYRYDLESSSYLGPHRYLRCKVHCSPLRLSLGRYEARVSTSEGFQENNVDADAFVEKRSLGYTGDATDSMVHFFTTQGLYQRGFNYESCDSNGCCGSVTFNYPLPPEYFAVEGGTVSKFWIESGWEGTVGDRFGSAHSFTLRRVEGDDE